MAATKPAEKLLSNQIWAGGGTADPKKSGFETNLSIGWTAASGPPIKATRFEDASHMHVLHNSRRTSLHRRMRCCLSPGCNHAATLGGTPRASSWTLGPRQRRGPNVENCMSDVVCLQSRSGHVQTDADGASNRIRKTIPDFASRSSTNPWTNHNKLFMCDDRTRCGHSSCA